MDLKIYQLLFFLAVLMSTTNLQVSGGFVILGILVFYYFPDLQMKSLNKLFWDTFKTTLEPGVTYNETNGDLPITPITEDDPYQNNVDSDVLKHITELTPEQQKEQDKYAHKNFFVDVSEFGHKTMDRILYTTPADDTEAYIQFLGYNVQRDTGTPKYEDLRQTRRDFELL